MLNDIFLYETRYVVNHIKINLIINRETGKMSNLDVLKDNQYLKLKLLKLNP